MTTSFFRQYAPVFLSGIAAWLLALVAAVVAAFLRQWPAMESILTVWDATSILLLLPWSLGAAFAEMSRGTTVQGAMVRSGFIGANSAAVDRDIREAMEGRGWRGGISTFMAGMGLVVLTLDVLARVVTGFGYRILPLLG